MYFKRRSVRHTQIQKNRKTGVKWGWAREVRPPNFWLQPWLSSCEFVCACVSNKRSVTVFASLSYSCWFGSLNEPKSLYCCDARVYLRLFKESAIGARPCKRLPDDLLNVALRLFQIWDAPALFEDKAAIYFMCISQKLTSCRSRVWSSAGRFLLWEEGHERRTARQL